MNKLHIKVTKLSCIYFNAESLTGKIAELEVLVALMKPDIIGIIETLCDEMILDSELTVCGYNTFWKNRVDKRGGGVILSTLTVTYELRSGNSKIYCLSKYGIRSRTERVENS